MRESKSSQSNSEVTVPDATGVPFILFIIPFGRISCNEVARSEQRRVGIRAGGKWSQSRAADLPNSAKHRPYKEVIHKGVIVQAEELVGLGEVKKKFTTRATADK